MRLDQHAGLGHLLFLQLQDVAQGVHLPAHVLEHLVHGIYFDFALLVAFVLQAGYAVLTNRYEILPAARRVLGGSQRLPYRNFFGGPMAQYRAVKVIIWQNLTIFTLFVMFALFTFGRHGSRSYRFPR